MKKPSPKKAPAPVYHLTVTLLGPKPPIWRILLAPECNLELLDCLIQAVMGWQGTHLAQFEKGKRKLADPMGLDQGFGLVDVEDWSTVSLGDLVPPKTRRTKLVYLYDFGDDWRHEIAVEQVFAPLRGVKPPVCMGGARACPPEDVGGVEGYQELLEILAGPKNKRHREMLQWLGGPFDPEAFSVVETNDLLRELWPALTGPGIKGARKPR